MTSAQRHTAMNLACIRCRGQVCAAESVTGECCGIYYYVTKLGTVEYMNTAAPWLERRKLMSKSDPMLALANKLALADAILTAVDSYKASGKQKRRKRRTKAEMAAIAEPKPRKRSPRRKSPKQEPNVGE